MASNQKKDERQKQFEKREKRRAIRKLHEAVNNNDLNLVRELLVPDLNVDFEYDGGKTALQIAVCNGNREIAELLIKNGANVDKCNAEDNSLLNMAAWRGYASLVKLLIDNDANVDMVNNNGFTPLNTAAYRGFAEVVQVLFDSDCNVNRPNNQMQTPLMSAAANGNIEVLKVLLDGKCDLNFQDNERYTPLIKAAEKGYLDVVQMLIDAGCNLNATDRYRCTALYMAAKEGHKSVVETLIKAGADLDLATSRNVTPFLEAVRRQHLDIITLLCEAGCNVNKAENEMNQAPIHSALRIACQYFGSDKGMKLAKMMVNSGCDLNVADKFGWTPICQCAFGGEIEITKLLLSLKVNVTVTTETGDTPLHMAVFGNKPILFNMLIKEGCDVNSVNVRNELPLYTAIEQRANIEIIQQLLDAGSKTDICENQNHQSPLFAAIQHDYIEAVSMLIKAGCNINTPNENGDTPLWVACDKGNEDIVHALVKHPKINLDAGREHIPLHAAAVQGYIGIAKFLLESGCNVNSLTNICSTALLLAAERDNYPMAELLIKWGANPSAAHFIKQAKCCSVYHDAHPHLELEPLYPCISNNSFNMLKIIIAATPKMPYKILTTLRDIIFRTGYAEDTRMHQQTLLHYAEFFVRVLSNPRELQAECRGCIRQVLGTAPMYKVDKLPMPRKLREYILFKDIIKD